MVVKTSKFRNTLKNKDAWGYVTKSKITTVTYFSLEQFRNSLSYVGSNVKIRYKDIFAVLPNAPAPHPTIGAAGLPALVTAALDSSDTFPFSDGIGHTKAVKVFENQAGASLWAFGYNYVMESVPLGNDRIHYGYALLYYDGVNKPTAKIQTSAGVITNHNPMWGGDYREQDYTFSEFQQILLSMDAFYTIGWNDGPNTSYVSMGYGRSRPLKQEGQYSGIVYDLHNTTQNLSTLGMFMMGTQRVNDAPTSKDDNDDPTDQDPSDGGGGGGGDSDNDSPINLPPIPTLSATDTNFCRIYVPTLQQVKNLANYMWGSDFFSAIKKMFANPMDAIIGFSMIPCEVASGGVKNVTVGNIDTGISMNTASSQFIDVNLGRIKVGKKYNMFLDYSPYTKIQIVLPFIGARSINTDDVMGRDITLTYRIDILSGACTAFLVADYGQQGNKVLYTFAGNVAVSIPLSGRDFSQIVQTAVGVATTLGTAGIATGVTAEVAGAAALSSASSVMGLKPDIERGGNVSGSPGYIGMRKAYLIITRPVPAIPKNNNTFFGYPSNIYSKVGDLKGFTKLKKIHTAGTTATREEQEEIEQMFSEGVYLQWS